MHSTAARRVALALSLGLAVVVPFSALAASHASTTAPAAFRPYTVLDSGNKVATGGEPSIGYDPKRNAIVYGAGGHETLMTFRDTTHGTSVAQTSVTAPTAKQMLDAITFTDKYT